MTCPTCGGTKELWNGLLQEYRPCIDCAVHVHLTPKPDAACDHDFAGWREFSDGNGGEQVCTKCGMGAMSYTLHCGD